MYPHRLSQSSRNHKRTIQVDATVLTEEDTRTPANILIFEQIDNDLD